MPSLPRPRVLRHPELLTLAVAHLDCHAFYASVEKRDDPRLRDRPVIVGGVVTTACAQRCRCCGAIWMQPHFGCSASVYPGCDRQGKRPTITIFSKPASKRVAAERAADQIRRRFGQWAITLGRSFRH